MFESSKNHPPEADEFEKACLTPAPREVVGSPRVEEADVSMKCLLDRVLPLGTDHLIIGRMVRFHVRDELEGRTVFESGGCGKNCPLRIVARKLRLLGALGLFTS
jgi:flavin reductase (DIM6/NTAB) family NADH-FMN oxidoreductase RutF